MRAHAIRAVHIAGRRWIVRVGGFRAAGRLWKRVEKAANKLRGNAHVQVAETLGACVCVDTIVVIIIILRVCEKKSKKEHLA